MGAVRAATILAGYAGLTLPLIPLQALLLRVSPNHARKLPHWYHRQVCKLLGIRIDIDGKVANDRPLLLVANHSSWLDIPVMSAIAPVSFIAKKEVSQWPGVSILARLQRTAFIDRDRRTSVKETTKLLQERLADGDTLVLFAEGTSSDGARVLPFKSSLFAAAISNDGASKKEGSASSSDQPMIQTLTVAYTRLHGIPLGRADRPLIGWYGDMEMLGHAWQLLKSGPIDVKARVGNPFPLASFTDRKAVTRATETQIRETLVRILRDKSDDDVVNVAPPQTGLHGRRKNQASSKPWT